MASLKVLEEIGMDFIWRKRAERLKAAAPRMSWQEANGCA